MSRSYKIKFSLRVLLSAVFAVTVLLAGGKHQFDQAVSNRSAANAIWQLGGGLQYDWMVDGGRRYPRVLRWIGDEYVSTIRTVSLTGHKVTDESVCELLSIHSEALQQVTAVSFRNCPITGKSLSEFASLQNITTLLVADTDVTDRDILQVMELPKLRELTLENSLNDTSIRTGHISIAGIRPLSSLPNLKSLTLQNFYVDDQALEWIANFKHLSTLDLQIQHSALSDVSDQGIMRLKDMICVRRLGVRGEGITDASMAVLRTLTNLQNLSLFQTSVTDDCLKEIGSLKNLRSLSVYSPKLTDKCLLYLKGMQNLQYLTLPGRPSFSPELQSLRDAIWEEFNGDVPLVQTGISASAAKEFKKSSAPTLTFVRFRPF